MYGGKVGHTVVVSFVILLMCITEWLNYAYK